MARRFRIESLPKEQQDKLRQFSNQFFPGELKQQFLDSIEKTGGISPELLQKGNFNPQDQAMVSSEVSKIVSGLPSQQESLNEFIGSQTDVPNLTDQELQDRLQALTTLGQIPSGETVGADTNKMAEEIYQATRDYKLQNGFPISKFVSDNAIREAARVASNELVADKFSQQNFVERLRDSGLGGNSVNDVLGFAGGINNNIREKLARGEYRKVTPNLPSDFSPDIKTAQDIIAARAKKSAANADIMSFFEKAPGELSTAREAFFDPQRQRAKDYIQQVYAPGVKERLAARGLQNSGEVASAITSKYADLFGGINNAESQQLVNDVNFFQQQAYDKTFSDLVNAGADVRGAIQSERQRLRTQQITDFGRGQADIESKFNFDLFKEQSKAAFDTYQKEVARKQDAVNRQNEADLFQNIGQTATTVAIASAL